MGPANVTYTVLTDYGSIFTELRMKRCMMWGSRENGFNTASVALIIFTKNKHDYYLSYMYYMPGTVLSAFFFSLENLMTIY